MSRRVHRAEAQAALQAIVQSEVQAVASDLWLSRKESPRLDALYRRVEADMRAEGGRGARVRTTALIARVVAEVLAAWERVDPAGPGLDSALLSKDEIREVLRLDPEAGAVLARVAEVVRAAVAPAPPSLSEELALAVKEALGGLALEEQSLSEALPGATRLDARVGHSGRSGLPAAVIDGFDAFYRLEARDIGSAALYAVTVADTPIYLLYARTDGDESWMELWTRAGSPVASSRWYGGRLLLWDEYFGRGRVDAVLLQIGGYTWEEGLSEPEDRAAASQVPRDWLGEEVLDDGLITSVNGRMGEVQLTRALSDRLRDLAWAALSLVWDKVLRHRVERDQPRSLGGRRGDGVLTIGAFTRAKDGVTYEAAWWRDIDDASFVFYLRWIDGCLKLVIEQFDN